VQAYYIHVLTDAAHGQLEARAEEELVTLKAVIPA
jgi:hypothetical protein